MAKEGVQIELDSASKANLEKQFTLLGTTVEKAGRGAIYKVLNKIKTTAQLRLRDRGT